MRILGGLVRCVLSLLFGFWGQGKGGEGWTGGIGWMDGWMKGYGSG